MKNLTLILILLIHLSAYTQNTFKTFEFSDTAFEVGMINYLPEIPYFQNRGYMKAVHRNLKPLVEFLRKNPEVKIEIRNHIHGYGDSTFNYNISWHQIQYFDEYLQYNEIDSNRYNLIALGDEFKIMPENLIKAYKKTAYIDSACFQQISNMQSRIEIIIIEIKQQPKKIKRQLLFWKKDE
jgi:hypothetical protein